MKNISIKSSLILALFLGISLPIFIAGSYIQDTQKKEALVNFEEYRKNIVHHIALTMINPLDKFSPNKASLALEVVKQDTRIVTIKVYDELSEMDFITIDIQERKIGNIFTNKQDIFKDQEKIGYVQISFSDALVTQALQAQRNSLLNVAIFTYAALMTIIFPLLYMKILLPLETLLRQSHDLSENRLESKFTWTGTDEINTLGRSFEQAKKSILSLIGELQNKNDELQKNNLILEESSNYNTHLLNASNDGKIVIDRDFQILHFNTIAELLFDGLKTRMNIFDFFEAYNPQEFKRLETFFNLIKINKNASPIVFHAQEAYYQISSNNINDTQILIIIDDITSIYKKKVFNETLLDTSRSIILTTDGIDLKSINKRFFEIFDFVDFEDFKKKHMSICELFIAKEPFYVMPGKDGINWLEQLKSVPKSSSLGVNKVCMLDKKGNERIFQVDTSGVVLEGNKEEVVTLSEITILIKNKKLLEQQTKHAAMGEMISMIAHQWRQPLTTLMSINTKLNILYSMDMLTHEKFHQSHETSKEVITHLSQTINDFRNYFHAEDIQESITISKLLNKSISLFQTALHENSIELILEYEDALKEMPLTLATSKFTQVLLNLFKNALDAIVANNVEDKYIKISVYRSQEFINISIEDSAGGIAADIIDKIFQPYFSTKSLNGTGLGLYMSKMIIEGRFKGFLSVKNSSNGARFTIQIPELVS